MEEIKFSNFGEGEDIDKNHYKVEVNSFKVEAILKGRFAEVRWHGYEQNIIKFSIYNSSDKTIPFDMDNITLIDTYDNVLKCEIISSPPKEWISTFNTIDIYDDMLVRFIFKVKDIDDNAELKRFIYGQRFYIGDGWRQEYSLFDFKLKLK